MTLSASDKANMPTMALDIYYDYVNIKRKSTGSQNALGEPAITWAEVSGNQNIKCDIQGISAGSDALRQLLVGQETVSSHAIFFLEGADIEAGDKVEANDAGTIAYMVDAVKDWDSHLGQTSGSRVAGQSSLDFMHFSTVRISVSRRIGAL